MLLEGAFPYTSAGSLMSEYTVFCCTLRDHIVLLTIALSKPMCSHCIRALVLIETVMGNISIHLGFQLKLSLNRLKSTSDIVLLSDLDGRELRLDFFYLERELKPSEYVQQ